MVTRPDFETGGLTLVSVETNTTALATTFVALSWSLNVLDAPAVTEFENGGDWRMVKGVTMIVKEFRRCRQRSRSEAVPEESARYERVRGDCCALGADRHTLLMATVKIPGSSRSFVVTVDPQALEVVVATVAPVGQGRVRVTP